MLTKLAIATPSRVPISSSASIAAAVAVVGQLGDQRAGQLAALGQRPAEPRVRALAGHPQRLAGQRGARGEGLDAAVVGTVALAGRPVELDHHVPELGRRRRSQPR